ncbi:MAG: hypothetical protein MJZ38_02555 [archaeon]|nr:hypothetical protein [archaeon]
MDNDHLTTLNERLDLRIRDLSLLEKALCTEKVTCVNEGFNADECRNRALAEVGDAVLELVLAETLCSEGKRGRRISDIQRSPGRTMLLGRIAVEEGICSPEDAVNRLIEALIGAKMMESGYYGCRDWITRWLRPRLTGMMGRGFEDCPAREERRSCSREWERNRWM